LFILSPDYSREFGVIHSHILLVKDPGSTTESVLYRTIAVLCDFDQYFFSLLTSIQILILSQVSSPPHQIKEISVKQQVGTLLIGGDFMIPIRGPPRNSNELACPSLGIYIYKGYHIL
jgi:hypothetical protein